MKPINFFYKSLILITALISFQGFSQNLLVNGDFESGSVVGFFSNGAGYTRITPPFSGSTNAGNWALTTNPQLLNTSSFVSTGDHTSGTGFMMVVDGNTTGGQQNFWEAGNAGGGVCGLSTGSTYTFSYWIRSVYGPVSGNPTPAILGVDILNANTVTLVSGSLTAPPTANGWQQVVFTFRPNGSCVNIKLFNNNTNFDGNDFAIDDMSVTAIANNGQLGFCSGSKGEPVFKENFGSGTNYGPQLPAGTTNYTYVGGGFPQDGQYTLHYTTNLIPNSQNWHTSLDHTPDNEIDGINGKSLIVNASFTAGDFFKRTVTGLCVNTRFEFSAWVLNIYNSASGGCPGTGIPINISFEIWNDTETVLLQSGNTGDIAGTPTPNWIQYGLVFTTTNQTSVVLKMKNNGVGGCGNDLAIDDIMFRSCGDLTTISSPSAIGTTYTVCQENSPVNITLQANTSGTFTYFYQWQQSVDNIIWLDIPGANSTTYITPGITSPRYYRTKVAQDIANLNNNFCSTLSDIFTVSFLPSPNPPTSNGNFTICTNQTIPFLSVTANVNLGVNWYDAATGGNLLLPNSLIYLPTIAGTYYAETFTLSDNCRSATRTPLTLTINTLPPPTFTQLGPYCLNSNPGILPTISNNTTTINGTWSPATISTSTVGSQTYTFTPNAGQCATSTTMNVTITALVVPTFTQLGPYCQNATPGILPLVSNNSATISGTWSPSAIATSTVGSQTYTFTASAGQCANSIAMDITVTAPVVPTFTQLGPYCQNATPGILPLVSNNSATISGTWSPSAIATSTVGTQIYTFTASAGQCASSTTMDVTVTAPVVPTFTQLGPYCQNATPGILPLVSNNSATITGTWSPATITTNILGTLTYTFTPNAGQCAISTTMNITVTATVFPTFTQLGPYCQNTTPGILPLLSNNSATIAGTWSPSAISTSTVGTQTYTFTPLLSQCVLISTMNITVERNPNPIINTANNVTTICVDFNSNLVVRSLTLNSGITNPANYTFEWFEDGSTTPIPGATGPSYTVNTASPTGATRDYTVTVTSTSLQACQTTSLPFSVIQSGQAVIVGPFGYTATSAFSSLQTITVNIEGYGAPDYQYSLDDGPRQTSNVFENVSFGTHVIHIWDGKGDIAYSCEELIIEDVQIIDYLHYFTPNGDGIHDTWNIVGLADKPETRIYIFDRYGKLLKQISSTGAGWDGTYNGSQMPSDDYWFTVDYEEGTMKQFKAHFTLKR